MTSSLPPYLRGPERLERWALARKVVRMGSPEALSIGDLDRALGHARAGRRDDALGYVEVVHPGDLMMVEVTYEWCVRVTDELAREAGEEVALAVAADAEALWAEILALDPAHPMPAVLAPRLSPAWLGAHRAAYLRRRRTKTMNLPDPELTAELERLRAAVGPAFDGGPDAACAAITAWHEHARGLHDAMMAYLWASSDVLARRSGDEVVERVVNRAFAKMPALNLLWPALHLFSATDGVLFMAEHLRAHFSGPGRRSTVTLVEEADRFRLVADPCGSGGAVRRLVKGTPYAGTSAQRDPSPRSWGERDVPFYCTHCAHNELRSAETIGFPRWVTEYTSDPDQPCGWTIYKRPEDIPERYFTRIGLVKDPTRFRRTGGIVGTLKALAGVLGVVIRSR